MNTNLLKLSSNLSSVLRLTQSQVRGFRKIPEFEGGIKYHGFTYHPRSPDEKDPPIEPTKLFLVERIRPYYGINYVEKNVLDEFNINGEKRFNGHRTIVKNTPQVNALLWKIKHLIKITPIKLVNGLPEDGDLTSCWLKENGDFIVSKKLKVEEKRLRATEEYYGDVKRLEGQTLKKQMRLEWLSPFGGVIERE